MFEQEFESMLRQYKDRIADKKVFSGLVKDFFPDQIKNINLLLMAYNMGIAQEIENTARINNTFAYRYVKQLVDDYGLSRLNADWIVSIWCVCYGSKVLGKPCDINLPKQGGGPAIKDDQPSGGKQYGDLFSYKKSMLGNGVGVTGFSGTKKDTIIFQNRANNALVIEICDGSFSGQVMEEAVITEGIAYIGKRAFAECVKLHQIVLPISIKEIGDGAMMGCSSLKSVSLPMQLEKLGAESLRGTGLRTIAFPKSLYWIGERALADCTELNNIVIPDNIDRLPEGLFEGCTSLKKITLPDNLEVIGDRAFFNCCNLDFIVIPDSVRAIGENSFTGTDRQFIIQCSFGSYAEEYCRKQKIKYQLV